MVSFERLPLRISCRPICTSVPPTSIIESESPLNWLKFDHPYKLTLAISG
jgi:hypothetical protein